jgi:membrane associated rhomboid family serine protease
LRGRLRPRITVLLVLLNVFVFAAGYYYARQMGLDAAFLRGTPVTLPVKLLLERSGALVPSDLIDGEWWRLLTAGFVHIGFLHILMNMACLYFAGRFIEHMWGSIRYLVIYLVAVLGGSVLAAAHPIGLFAGASGGVCGILAAEGVWFLFNRHYLPRALLRQERNKFFINFVLLVFISSFENVSGWGHFGGAAAGALAALLLQLQRFGPPVWRWLALVGFVPMAWYGQYAIEHARATDPKWLEIEDQQFVDRHVRPIQKAMKKAREVYVEEIKTVLEVHPTRRDAANVETVLPILAEQERELTNLADGLARAGPYHSPDAEQAREVGRQYVLAEVELFNLAGHILRQGEKRTDNDQRALREQEQQVEEQQQEWRKLFQ